MLLNMVVSNQDLKSNIIEVFQIWTHDQTIRTKGNPTGGY